jgi:hypothetical protein
MTIHLNLIALWHPRGFRVVAAWNTCAIARHDRFVLIAVVLRVFNDHLTLFARLAERARSSAMPKPNDAPTDEIAFRDVCMP